MTIAETTIAAPRGHEAGEGEPLVLVHGSWTDHETWALTVPELATRARVLSYDRFGSAIGDDPGELLERRRHEDDLAALIESLPGSRAHVAGNSYGGCVALGLAVRRPELFLSVAAHEPPFLALAADDPGVRAAAASIAAVTETADAEASARRFAEEVALGPGMWELLPDAIRATMVRNADTFAAEMRDVDCAAIDLEALGRLDVPMLLTSGEASLDWYAPIMDVLAAAAPQARTEVIGGAGHVPHATHPAEYSRVLADFATQAPPRAAGRVRLATCVELPYVEQGDPDGVPVLLLHGVTDSLRSWEPMLPHLPGSLRVVAITQRGHRGSAGEVAAFEIEDYAADALAAIDTLGLERPIVVGMSMGAFVTEQLLAEHWRELRAAVLVGPIGKGRANEPVAGFAAELAALADPVPRELALEFQESTIARPIAPDLLELFVNESLGARARVWRESFEGFLRWDVSDRLAEASVPVLLAHGDQDAFGTDEEAAWLVDTLPDARLSTYEGTGHAVHWEEPERLAREIAELAASL